MKVSVRGISISSRPECRFFLKVEWAEDLGAGFVVMLCDGVSAWTGEVSEEDVSREAQEMEMVREKYVHDLQLVLTGEDQPSQSYSFHLESESAAGTLLLSYEKVQRDVSFRLGMVELLPVPEPAEVIRELISFGLECRAGLQAKNRHLLEENQTLRNEQERMTAEMERYVQGKEALEGDLYSRFVLVLNEKKAKIRALQEKIRQLQESVEEEKQRRKKGVSGRGESVLAEEKSGEESDYGGTTEDEREDEDPKSAPQKPSSQETLASPMDDSLNDLTDVAPSRKRRQRHLQQLEHQHKRAAVEPRQSSGNAFPEEARAEVRKAPVQRPPPVTPDPDDLFDDI